jgi:hypothetical protein
LPRHECGSQQLGEDRTRQAFTVVTSNVQLWFSLRVRGIRVKPTPGTTDDAEVRNGSRGWIVVVGTVVAAVLTTSAGSSDVAASSTGSSAGTSVLTFAAGDTAAASASVGARRADAFVRRHGDQLLLRGAPWTFTGINVYNASSRWTCWYGMDGTSLATAFATTGATVMRSWFFESLVVDRREPTAIDWAPFDETLAAARAAGVRVVATLTDQWGACEPGGQKGLGWYRSGYRVDRPVSTVTGAALPMAYRDYVAAIVARYRDDPTILSWQLVNEPEGSEPDHSCTADAGATLVAFTRDMAGLVRTIDGNHLLSMGTIGSGQCGTTSDDYRAMIVAGDLDWCEVHDYEGTEPFGGDQWNGLEVRRADCAALAKPFVVGEAGVRADVPGGMPARAEALVAKLDAERAHRASGFLVWGWGDPPDGDLGPYSLGPADPLWTDPRWRAAAVAG